MHVGRSGYYYNDDSDREISWVTAREFMLCITSDYLHHMLCITYLHHRLDRGHLQAVTAQRLLLHVHHRQVPAGRRVVQRRGQATEGSVRLFQNKCMSTSSRRPNRKPGAWSLEPGAWSFNGHVVVAAARVCWCGVRRAAGAKWRVGRTLAEGRAPPARQGT